MALNIITADQALKLNNIIMLIYGLPGIGKTSLACSANKSLLLDFDNSGSIKAIGRTDTVIIKSWDDIESININDLYPYDTIVIDTVGRALEILSLHIGSNSPNLMKKNGQLSLQGYGELSATFKTWINKLVSYNKDIILIAHAEEKQGNKDELLYRINCPGSTKDFIYQLSHIIAPVLYNNKKRTIDFTTNDFTISKNPADLPLMMIPDYSKNDHFMADIINLSKSNINKRNIETSNKHRDFKLQQEKINNFTLLEQFNDALKSPDIMGDAILKTLLNKSAINNKFSFDKDKKEFIGATSQ